MRHEGPFVLPAFSVRAVDARDYGSRRDSGPRRRSHRGRSGFDPGAPDGLFRRADAYRDSGLAAVRAERHRPGTCSGAEAKLLRTAAAPPKCRAAA